MMDYFEGICCCAKCNAKVVSAINTLETQLATVTTQRDELLRAAKEAEEVLALMERPSSEDPSYAAEVRALGERIGFGALMASASASWREQLKETGIVGSEYCSGPCHDTVLVTLCAVRAAIAATSQDQGGAS